MSKVYEIAFKMGGELTGTFTKTMRGANSALSDLQKQIKNIGGENAAIDNLQEMQKRVGGLSREYTKAQAEAQRLAKEIAATEKPTKAQQSAFEKAKTASSKLKNELMQQRSELQKVRSSAGLVGKSYQEVTRRQKELAAQTEKLNASQRTLQTTMAKQAANKAHRDNLRGQMLDAAGLAVALAAPIRKAAQFEQAMAGVGAVSGANEKQMSQLTATARELGATTNWSASQAAEGMKFLAQAGFSAEQTTQAMPGMLDLASAGAIDLAKAADIASNVLSGFGMEAAEMARVGDVMTNTFTNSNTDLNMLGETMKYVAPIAAASGVAIEQVAAMTGKLGDAGIQGSEAGTALRGILTRLSAPSKAAAKALEELGVNTKDSEGNLRDMPTVLAEMQAAMSGMGNAAKLEYTKAIFETEAMSAATILMEQSANGSLQKFQQGLYKTGSASEVAREQNETAMGALKRLGSATESIAITIGNVLLPTLASGAEMMASVVGVADKLAQQFPLLTKVVVGATAAMVALKVASVAGGYAWTFVSGAGLQAKKVIDTLRVAYLLNTGVVDANTAASKKSILMSKAMALAIRAAAGAQALFNAVLLANPIGLIIAGIAALIAAGVMLYKNWDVVKSFLSGFWDGFKAGIQPVINAFEPLKSSMAPVVNMFSGLWNQVKSAVTWFGNLFAPVNHSSEVLERAGNAGQTFGNIIGTVFRVATFPITMFVKVIGSVIKAFIDAKNWIASFSLSDAVSGVVDGAKWAFMNLNPLGWTIKAFQSVTSWLGGFSLYNSGKKIIQTLSSGVMSRAKQLVNSVKNIFSKVREYLPFSDAKVGPFSDLTKSGSAIISTLAAGVDKSQGLEGEIANKLMTGNAKINAQVVGSAANQPESQSIVNRVRNMGDNVAKGGNSYSITVEQNISVSGGGTSSDVRKSALDGAREGVDNLSEKLSQLINDQRRVSYG